MEQKNIDYQAPQTKIFGVKLETSILQLSQPQDYQNGGEGFVW